MQQRGETASIRFFSNTPCNKRRACLMCVRASSSPAGGAQQWLRRRAADWLTGSRRRCSKEAAEGDCQHYCYLVAGCYVRRRAGGGGLSAPRDGRHVVMPRGGGGAAGALAAASAPGAAAAAPPPAPPACCWWPAWATGASCSYYIVAMR